jgi:hypothetical protein
VFESSELDLGWCCVSCHGRFISRKKPAVLIWKLEPQFLDCPSHSQIVIRICRLFRNDMNWIQLPQCVQWQDFD